MTRQPSYRSFLGTVAVFWIFSSISRIFFLTCEGAFRTDRAIAIASLVAGFIADGAFTSLLFLPLQLLDSRIRRLSDWTISLMHAVFVGLLATGLALSMANTEYLRFFGSNANLTHLSFVTESEALLPSLADIFPIWKLLLDLVVVPGAFVVVCRLGPWWRFDLFAKRRMGTALAVLALAAGLIAPQFWPVTESVWKNAASNYFLSVIKFAFVGDELQGQSKRPIAEILDTLPLPHPRAGAQPWFYIDPRFPLAKASAHHMCRLGLWDARRCAVDNDGDGSPLKDDCNDWDPRSHPGAVDIPRNGVDEDCSGIDADPPNIIFIHWEGARAVDVGSIGYNQKATPNFDRWAKKGVLFRNAYANGTQTRWSLTSIYNSVLPRLSSKWIFKHNRDLNLQAWPQILKNFGYQTIYIHSADINFGNFSSRFWEWFDVQIDRKTERKLRTTKKVGWGASDKQLFRYVIDYLANRTDKRPFYMTIATVSVHHPFKMPEKKYIMGDPEDLDNQVPNIIHYADAALGEFLDVIMNDKRYANTIIIIAADHGLNWFSPHSAHTHSTLWEDLVWVPVLLLGNWGEPPSTVDEIRQLGDIGPTILDRLGIEVPNHFMGQSLLRRFGDREAKAFFGNSDSGPAGGIRIGNDKYFYNFQSGVVRFYDMKNDRRELHNLAGTAAVQERQMRYYRMLVDVYSQNASLIQEDRFWKWKWSLDTSRNQNRR